MNDDTLKPSHPVYTSYRKTKSITTVKVDEKQSHGYRSCPSFVHPACFSPAVKGCEFTFVPRNIMLSLIIPWLSLKNRGEKEREKERERERKNRRKERIGEEEKKDPSKRSAILSRDSNGRYWKNWDLRLLNWCRTRNVTFFSRSIAVSKISVGVVIPPVMETKRSKAGPRMWCIVTASSFPSGGKHFSRAKASCSYACYTLHRRY